MVARQPADDTFRIVLKDFHLGIAPLAHLDTYTELGSAGQSSSSGPSDIISKPPLLNQSPSNTVLTAGDQTGAVTDVVRFILDQPPIYNQTFAISDTKLHALTSSAVLNSGIWPHTISGAAGNSNNVYRASNSVSDFQGNLYYFYNKSSGADIGKYDYNVTFDDDWGSTVPTGAAALQNAPHPVATQQDIMLFGNGRYVGTYVSTTNTLAPTKLDFGANAEAADVAFHANQWLIAINTGASNVNGITSGRTQADIYYYDGAALTSILSDETKLGIKKIGWILPKDGVIYVCYQDMSGTSNFSFVIGYISGRSIKPLKYFVAQTIPTFGQKTVLLNTILLGAYTTAIYSCGAVVDQLPVQLSYFAAITGTVTAVAAPFGTVFVGTSDFVSSYKIVQLNTGSAYDTASAWASIVIPLIKGTMLGTIDRVIVRTPTLLTGAACQFYIAYNQGSGFSTRCVVSASDKSTTRHVFKSFALPATGIEDFYILLQWSNGSSVNPCPIREIQILGHYVESS